MFRFSVIFFIPDNTFTLTLFYCLYLNITETNKVACLMLLKQSLNIPLIYFQKFMKNCIAEKQFINVLFINYQKQWNGVWVAME